MALTSTDGLRLSVPSAGEVKKPQQPGGKGGLQLSENMPSSEVKKPCSPGKSRAEARAAVKKPKQPDTGGKEGLRLSIKAKKPSSPRKAEAEEVSVAKTKEDITIEDLGAEDSDSDETGKNDAGAKEYDKESVEFKFKAEKSSQEVTNLKNTLKSSLEQAELINCQAKNAQKNKLAEGLELEGKRSIAADFPFSFSDETHSVLRLRGGGNEDDAEEGRSNDSETAHDSEAEDLEFTVLNSSVAASFKLFCFNDSATSIPPPLLSEEEELSEDQESDLEESETHNTAPEVEDCEFVPLHHQLMECHNKEEHDLKRRPGDWHHYEEDKKCERPGPQELARVPDMAYGNMTVNAIEEEDGITVPSQFKENYKRSEAQLRDLAKAREDQRSVGGGVYRCTVRDRGHYFLHIKKGGSNIIGLSLVMCKDGAKPRTVNNSFAKMNYERYDVKNNRRVRKTWPQETEALGYVWYGHGGDLPFPDKSAREAHICCERVERDMHYPGKLCDRRTEAPGASQLLCSNPSCGVVIWTLSRNIFLKRGGVFVEEAREDFALVTFRNGIRSLLWTDRNGNETLWAPLEDDPVQENFKVPASSLQRIEDIVARGCLPEPKLAVLYVPEARPWQELEPVRRQPETSQW